MRNKIISLLILVGLLFQVLIIDVSKVYAAEKSFEATYLEWLGWWQSKAVNILEKHNVPPKTIFDIVTLLNDYKYFGYKYEDKVLFIQRYYKQPRFKGIEYIGELDNIPKPGIITGSIMKAEKRGFWDKALDRKMKDDFKSGKTLDFPPLSMLLSQPEYSANADNIIYYNALERIKFNDKERLSAQNIDFLYSPQGPLFKKYYKLKTSKIFTPNELDDLHTWAIKHTADYYTMNVAAGVSGGMEIKGGAAIKSVANTGIKNSSHIANEAIWKKQAEKKWHEITCYLQKKPRINDAVPVWEGNFNAENLYWWWHNVGLTVPGYSSYTDRASRARDVFHGAATKYNELMSKFPELAKNNVTKEQLMQMTYIGDNRPSIYINEPDVAGWYNFSAQKITLPEKVFLNKDIDLLQDVVVHEFLHHNYKLDYQIKRDLIQEGNIEFFNMQIFGQKVWERTGYKNETYAANLLFNKIKARYFRRTSVNIVDFTMSSHSIYTAPQRINFVFSTESAYQKINDLLLDLQKRKVLGSQAQIEIANLIKNLKMNMPTNLNESMSVFGLTKSELSNLNVKQRYNELTQKYHPDLTGGTTQEEMKVINKAYEIIKQYLGN